MNVITVLLLYIIFSFTSCLAGIVGILYWKNTSHISQAMDRLLAAMLGWDGHSTVSAECSKSECKFCKILCWILDKILEKDHCKRNAVNK